MRKNGIALRDCEDVESSAPARKQWRVEDSIFGKKPRENESRSYWDGDHIAKGAFDADWATCCKKARFERLVEKHAVTTRAATTGGRVAVGSAAAAAASALSAGMEAVKAALRERYGQVSAGGSGQRYGQVGAGGASDRTAVRAGKRRGSPVRALNSTFIQAGPS